MLWLTLMLMLMLLLMLLLLKIIWVSKSQLQKQDWLYVFVVVDVDRERKEKFWRENREIIMLSESQWIFKFTSQIKTTSSATSLILLSYSQWVLFIQHNDTVTLCWKAEKKNHIMNCVLSSVLWLLTKILRLKDTYSFSCCTKFFFSS